MMSLKVTKPIVSVNWLQKNLENKNLIILDCTIPKVTEKSNTHNSDEKLQVKGALFFDIKNIFSDTTAPFPNTILTPKEFEVKAQEIGVYKDSIIVCYDDLGIYSSPRVWWMFQLMGFTNVAVLDGGFPKWNENKFPVENQKKKDHLKGDFEVNYQPEKIKFKEDVLTAIKNKTILIVDARSKGRFNSAEPEPRNDVKGGHIPNSVSLPFNEVLENGTFKTEAVLKEIFKKINPKKKSFIFSCGTGITASVLALGAEISGIKNYAVYDGSWTEWGSIENLPIEI
ncbi:sulfurtransferase [Polaribacter atrinae]|nr:sulfurtransferase [Polaribacter atrinae]